MISIILIGLTSLTELWSGDERHRHGGSGIDTPPVGLSLQGDWRQSPMIREVVALKKWLTPELTAQEASPTGIFLPTLLFQWLCWL